MKQWNRYIYVVLMAIVLLWTGCQAPEEPREEVTFPLSIYLPADEVTRMTNGGSRKAPGDPGTTENFALPDYVYIIVMKKGAGDTWKLWRVITETDMAHEEKWTKKRYTGLLQTTGDSIYQYNKEFHELLDPGEARFDGRVYAIASAVELTFNRNLDSVTNPCIKSLSDLETLTFNSAPVQASLQHIYSTPYNYIVDGKFYGSFGSSQRVPHVDLMLYHVAAKVDITWNVADSARLKRAGVNPIRLTQMDACNLFNGDAYCFKPMENRKDGAPYVTTDTIKNIVSPRDEGLWWEGRSYFYTIPYTCSGKSNYFPLQMRLGTNDSTKYFRPTLFMEVNTSAPFVPWLRATFNLKKPLTAGTDSIDVSIRS